MKKIFLSIVAVFLTASLFSQVAPGLFKYQAVLRDAAGTIRANASVSIDVVILQGSADGDIVLSETFAVTTNAYGLVSLNIGSESPTDFGKINWADGPYFIQVLVDGTEMGTSQLLSVPYALYAEKANVPGVQGPQGPQGPAGEGGGGGIGGTDSVILTSPNGKVWALKVDDSGNLITTASNLPLVIDFNGNSYHQVVIGKQTWLKENLKATSFNDGTAILDANDNAVWSALIADTVTPAYGFKDGNDTLGAFYNWQVANTPGKNPCPQGYYVPSKNEWRALATYVGGIFESTAEGDVWTGAGEKLLSVAAGGTDDYGFSAAYTAIRDGGNGEYPGWSIGVGINYWTRGAFTDPVEKFAPNMSIWDGVLYDGAWYWNSGYNIRCVKGELAYDADGNAYTTVKIGNQTWLKENLRTTKFNDGTPILNAQSNAAWNALIADTITPAYSFREDTFKIIGAFYNWQVANTPGKNPCPSGFRVPTRDDFNALGNFAGGNYVTDWGGQWLGVGTKLRAVSSNGTDDFGFGAEIIGSRDGDGSSYHLDWTIARFWVEGPFLTPDNQATEIGFALTWDGMGVGPWYWNGGHNIRCIK